jgi:hypothetical protein
VLSNALCRASSEIAKEILSCAACKFALAHYSRLWTTRGMVMGLFPTKSFMRSFLLSQVFFYIDPEFAEDVKMKGINLLTLSYTFFKVNEDE